MDLRPTPVRPPWSYEGSSLDAPEGRPTFTSLTRRVARFRAEGFIDMGSRLLWFIWQHDPPRDMGNAVTQFMAPSLIAIGCAYGGPPHRPRPTELEFRLLCWELHQCAEASSGKLPEARMTALVLGERYDQLPEAHPLRRVPRGAVDHVWSDYFLGLTLQAQARALTYQPSDFVRPFAVYERMRGAIDGEGREALRKLEVQFFGIPWEHFVRSFPVFLAVAGSDALGGPCPGFVEIPPPGPLERELGVGVRVEDLRVFLDRLSTRVSDFRADAARLDALPEHARKHDPMVRRLDSRPVIVVDGDDGWFRAAVPSPWHARSAAASFVVDEFITFAADHAASQRIGGDPATLLGRAFHAHLDEAVGGCGGVKSVDTLYGAKQRAARHPDLLWLGASHGLLIEAKVRLTPTSDSWGLTPTSLFEAWERGLDAIEQCVAYLGRNADGHAGDVRARRWLVLIVTLQPLAAEATALRSLVKRWNLLDGTGIAAVAVVSAAELEHFALAGDADDYAGRHLAQWDALDPNAVARAPETVRFEEQTVSKPIAESWRRLLPGLPAPRQAPT